MKRTKMSLHFHNALWIPNLGTARWWSRNSIMCTLSKVRQCLDCHRHQQWNLHMDDLWDPKTKKVFFSKFYRISSCHMYLYYLFEKIMSYDPTFLAFYCRTLPDYQFLAYTQYWNNVMGKNGWDFRAEIEKLLDAVN